MTTESSAMPACRWGGSLANKLGVDGLSLAKEVLIAVALLAGIGLVLSIGSSALDLVALQ